MGRNVVTDQQAGFGGGLNIVSDPAFLRPDQAVQLENIKLSSYGAALKRLGTALSSTAAITTYDAGNGFFGGVQWPSDSYRIFVVCAATNGVPSHLYRSPYNFPNSCTWTDLGAINQPQGIVFSDGTNEVLYFYGQVGSKVQKWNGTTLTSLGASTANVEGLCVYNDRLWGWNGNTLYYSNLSSAVGSTGGDSLGDVTAGGGAIIVRTFAASSIRACAAVNGSLLIFHALGISVLTGWGQDDVQVQPQALNAYVGMGANGSLATLCVANELTQGDLAYFVTPNGVYVTNGGFVRPLGTPEKPDPIAGLFASVGGLSGTVITTGFNPAPNELWININNRGIYVYNVVLESWSGPLTGLYTASNGDGSVRNTVFFPVFTGSDASKRFLWAVTTNRARTGTDVVECDSFLNGSTPLYKDSVIPDGTTTGTGGTAVTATIQMHRMFGGDRMFAKSWRWVNVLASIASGSGGNASCTYATTISGSNSTTFGALSTTEQPFYVPAGGTGDYIDVTLSDALTTGQTRYAMATVQGNFLGQR